jgi:hypothetical protein
LVLGGVPDEVLPGTQRPAKLTAHSHSIVATEQCRRDLPLHDAPIRRMLSAQQRQPALACESVEGGLHHRANMPVHLADVWLLSKLGGDVDRVQYLG